jgi:hypothetical protein
LYFSAEFLPALDQLVMLKRREFLSGITALAGSYVLAACGGGGSDIADGAANAVAKAATATPSPDNTSIPPASSIVDTQGKVWTVSGGSVYTNGVAVRPTSNVTILLWYGSKMYHQNTAGQWYAWNGTDWLGTVNPRPSGLASPNGSAVPPSASVTDAQGAVWTLVNGSVARNGVVDRSTSNVAVLLWYNNTIYHQGTGGQWYGWSGTAWGGSVDPRAQGTPVAAGTFYGMNGHFDYTYTPAQIVSILKTMGASTYRLSCGADSNSLNALVKMAKGFQCTGMTLFVCIDQGVTDANGNVYANETVAYNAAYSTGATVAKALAPYGVTMYECGNELTRRTQTVLNSSCAGNNVGDFNNANWPAMRGVMRGLMDGVKSAQPTAKCGINFCVADTGASDALWDGVQPDGTTGHPTVRWDITTWHNYEVYGDIFAIGTDGAGPHFDLPAYCKGRYGVPFMVTEWNANPEQSQAYRATYITSRIGEFYAARKRSNIQSCMYFVLDSGDYTWGVMLNGTPLNPPYNAFKSFALANPDV